MATNTSNEKKIKWWELSLLGVACTIGTGFFLGSAVAITMAGPATIFSYILAGIGTYFVYEALATLTIEDPQEASFRSYAKKAFGRWAGFSSGWVYFLSEMLIMGSQLTALATFSKFWFSSIPLWIFASIYTALGIGVIILGAKTFDRLENLLAVLKMSAILMFIVLAILAITGVFKSSGNGIHFPKSINDFFPNHWKNFLPSLIFGFYGFGGIEVMGLLAVRLDKKEDVMKAGKVMLILLAIIYITSIGLSIIMVEHNAFSADESPLVTALKQYHIKWIPHIFNGVFIIAGFSTMVAALFGAIQILITLAQDRDAPHFLGKKIKDKYALPAIGITAVGMIVSVILALVLPNKIYEYFTTAAGLILLYNWFFILGSYGKLHKLKKSDNIKRLLAFLFIAIAVIGTLFHRTSRIGFFVSIGFVIVIALITLLMRKVWNRSNSLRK